MKKNIVIGVLIVIILIMGGSLFYLNTSKDKIRNNHNTQKTEPSKKEEVIEEEKSQETATDGNVKLLKGKYKYNEKRGTAATGTELDLNIELEIINDTEMTITSDDTLSEIETTKGDFVSIINQINNAKGVADYFSATLPAGEYETSFDELSTRIKIFKNPIFCIIDFFIVFFNLVLTSDVV